MTDFEATKAGRKFRDQNPNDFADFRQHHRKHTGRYGTLADYARFRIVYANVGGCSRDS